MSTKALALFLFVSPAMTLAPAAETLNSPGQTGKTQKRDSQKSATTPAAPVPAKAALSKEYSEGYESGFIVGETRHLNGEPPLPKFNLDSLSTKITKQPNSFPEYRAGFLKGYADGFAGLRRGGEAQLPAPKLPLLDHGQRSPVSRALGEISPKKGEPALTDALSGLINQSPEADLFVVTGQWRLTAHFTDHVKLIYDARHRSLVKLTRTTKSLEDTDSKAWKVFLDIEPADFAAGIPWGDFSRRVVSNREDNSSQSPVQYSRHKSVHQFP